MAVVSTRFMRIRYFDLFITSPIVMVSVFSFVIVTFSVSISSMSLIWRAFSSFSAMSIGGSNAEFSIFWSIDSLMFSFFANSSCVMSSFIRAFLILGP